MTSHPKVKPTILIVDDDPSVTTSLSLLVRRAGLRALTAANPAAAVEILATIKPDAIIQDMNFSNQTSGEEGMQLLQQVRRLAPETSVILLTAWANIALAVRGIKAGAFDFIAKPWDNEQVMRVLNTALSLAGHPAEEGLTREELDRRGDFSAIFGRDPALIAVLATVARVALTDASVLILGESGTGKELVAAALHNNSRRARNPFVKVNLGGISTSLFESEMFGHVRGAFTDARGERKGRFALAHSGTIFLDEIGDLDPTCQVKILRVLQDRRFEPLGSSHSLTADVRVISATNRDLPALVRSGDFREDLLYRLNLITLRLPPLRERRGDIPLLAESFLAEITTQRGITGAAISASALTWLQSLDWPGNIRQLRQTVERALLMSGKTRLEREDFVHPDLVSIQGPVPNNEDDLPPVGAMTLDEIERAMILKSLEFYQGNITRVARALGLSRAALYRRMEKFGIQP